MRRPASESSAGNIVQGGQRATSDSLSCVDHSLQSYPVCCCAPSVPHCDTVHQDALHGGSVEGHKQLLLQAVSHQHPQGMETLLSLLHHSLGVSRPGEVVRDADAQEFKGVDPFNAVPVDNQRGQFRAALTEVQDEFFCFCGVQ